MSQQATGGLKMSSSLFSSDATPAVTPGLLATLAALPLAFFILKRVVFPSPDAREPPVLRPTIPFVGHIIALMREQTTMFDRLHKNNPLPICSLPMLNGWLYVINDPSLVAIAMRHRDLSFDPFVIEFAGSAMGMTDSLIETYSKQSNLDEMTRVIHTSLANDKVVHMNIKALAGMSEILNGIRPGDGLDVPHTFDWLRLVMVMAATKGLFGKNNPFGPEDDDDMWEVEKGIGLLGLGIAPGLVAPKALAARARLQKKLQPFYINRFDEGEDVSAIIKNRAALHRQLGIADDEICLPEFSMVFAATSNTIAALSWFFLRVFADPDLVARIRSEVVAVTAVETHPDTGRPTTAAIDVTRLEKDCPTLYACYRECLRMYADAVGNRRVLRDTTLRDPVSGREYLLRKGTNVQWAARLLHHLEPAWGEDVREFRPERWLHPTSLEEKKRRAAMIPFGGGRHLCPGRLWAQAENLGVVAAVALGFEVQGAKVPESTVAYFTTAMKRPVGDRGPGIRITRMTGWEDTTWAYKCTSE